MTESTEEGPQPPRLTCPLHDCDWSITLSKLMTEKIAVGHANEHFDTHTREEILQTLNMLHEALFEAHRVLGPMRQRIEQQDSALRGASQHVRGLMEEIARLGGTPMPPGSVPEGPADGSGLLLPPGVAEGLTVVKEHKHGDVVEIQGEPRTLVGKRLSDAEAKRLGLPTREDHRKGKR